ncbi:hypothetical protein PENSPDRAFT_591385 [Peniophora sp. CONT]|nr:hypothetical protein PENSPDRAFT_591385 [Peniophora sp. CONT]
MATNMEEAAVVAADYISSLDNLPAEIAHLLAEIEHKDRRYNEIYAEIQKDGQKYVRHSKRDGTPMSAKDGQIPDKVQKLFVEADKLCEEKIKLAERIDALIARTRARLDHDLIKVLKLQGEEVPPSLSSSSYVSTSRSAAQAINESFRAASITLPEALPMTPVAAAGSPASAPPPKRRKITQTQSVAAIKLPSPAPVAIPPARAARLAQQTPRSRRGSPARLTSRKTTSPLDNDEDAEGEEDVENVDENEDSEIYCFCQKPSFGEMIGCDNEDCAYQWFHISCVKIRMPLPEQWYCSDCIKKGYALSVNQAGNKKKKR